jgi:formate dehydrogenase subunit gamma
MRLIPILLLSALLATSSHAAVPNRHAPPPLPEERTMQQTEQTAPEPGLDDSASGKQHLDRHYLGAYGTREYDVILQRGGNTWRVLRNGDLAFASGVVLLAMPLLIAGYFLLAGPIRLKHAPTGRQILRFRRSQRIVHWATALSFLLLAFSGLVILFGKRVLLPWLGHDAFATVAIVSKYLHNFTGPVFILCSVLLFLSFVQRNTITRADREWVRGLLARRHSPAGYFNLGEKLWFWGGLTLLGLLMSATGLVLDFVVFQQTRYVLQVADVLHVVGATLYMAGALGHIYMGTIGMHGAYRAMRDGTVDEQWAREHHALWYEEVAGRTEPDGAAPGPIR